MERLFTSWGGEALYNYYENDPDVGPALREIGVPTLVEAIVPITHLSSPDRVAMTVARLDVHNRRTIIKEVTRLEDYSVTHVGAQHIERLIHFPEAEFVGLTASEHWNPPLYIGKYP